MSGRWGERARASALSLGRRLGAAGGGHRARWLYLFFAFRGIGGAERVHADIVRCVADARPVVLLTGGSHDRPFRRELARGARVVSVGAWERHPLTRALLVGFLSGRIDRPPAAVVFGAKSRFFYDLLAALGRHVRKVDLIHAFGGTTAIEQASLACVPLLDCRVTVTRRTLDDFRRQYRASGLDDAYAERIRVVTNRVDVPAARPQKSGAGPLTALYVGRGSEEKRVHLVAEVARRCRAARLPYEFVFVGNLGGTLASARPAPGRFLGWIADRDELARVYRSAHVLLLASSREGFPLVVMEAMAQGVVPVATSVGGVAEHVTDGVNGFLVDAEPEERVVRSMLDALDRLRDRDRLAGMAAAAHAYALGHFAGAGFCDAYRKILAWPPRSRPQGR